MNKKIVLKIDGRKMEFSNDLLGYQHLMDYVSREVRERIPRKKRTVAFAAIEKTKVEQ